MGVEHRITSSYFPHANLQAELGVKSAKPMIRENIGANGSLKTDKFLRALMLHGNTPDRDTGMSPAQVVFGRSLRVSFPIKTGSLNMRLPILILTDFEDFNLNDTDFQK